MPPPANIVVEAAGTRLLIRWGRAEQLGELFEIWGTDVRDCPISDRIFGPAIYMVSADCAEDRGGVVTTRIRHRRQADEVFAVAIDQCWHGSFPDHVETSSDQ